MTIRNLEIFSQVCCYMNMSKAAQAMMISQSSVSQAIASLEKEFHVTLFERLNHKLYLTPAGIKMSFLAGQVLQSIYTLETNMKNEAYESPLRLGVCTTVGDSLIYPLINFCEEKYHINFNVEVNNSRYLEEQLLNARLDIAIMPVLKTSPYLEYVPFLKDQIVMICWKDHPLSGKTVSITDLEAEGFVTREKGSETERLLERAFAEYSLGLKKTWACNNPVSVKEAVKNKKGIAVISKYLVQKEIQDQQIGEIFLKEKLFERDFVLVYHCDKLQSEIFKKFISCCKEFGDSRIKKLEDFVY